MVQQENSFFEVNFFFSFFLSFKSDHLNNTSYMTVYKKKAGDALIRAIINTNVAEHSIVARRSAFDTFDDLLCVPQAL